MKKTILIFVVIIIGLTGCKQDFDIDVDYKKLSHEEKNTEGILMLTVTENLPLIHIEHYVEAADKINDYYEQKKIDFDVMIHEYFQQAQEDYAMRTQEDRKYWQGYGLGRNYDARRKDEKVLSIVQNNYEYSGGAHPNSSRVARNFNPVTGDRLTLEDITKDELQAREFINNYLLKEMQKPEYEGFFFEDYRESIEKILTEDTWYFSDEGFVIIVNEYIVSPHVVGILEFTIPYREFTLLKEKYSL